MGDFLFATMPMVGHTQPLRPIARALVSRGHRVRWYAGHAFADAVTATGATFVPMSDDLNASCDVLDDESSERHKLSGLSQFRWDLKHTFLDHAPRQVAELRRLVAEAPVDAVISDLGFFGSRLLAELGGPPCVTVGITPLASPSRDTAPFGTALPPSGSWLGRLRNRLLQQLIDRVGLRGVRAHKDRIRASVGLPRSRGPLIDADSPFLHLQNGVPEFEYPRSDLPPQVHFVGALVEPAGADTLPEWWAELSSGRPIVHVTQGTVADNSLDDLVLPTIRALADRDVLVIAHIGDHDPAGLGPLPANTRLTSFIPHDRLLPLVDVMVTNGGYGGVQTALRHGVPLVVAGATEDKPEVAARVAWVGAGINLRTGKPSADQLRAAIDEVLVRPAYRRHARRLQRAYAERDAGARAAELVEQAVGAVSVAVPGRS